MPNNKYTIQVTKKDQLRVVEDLIESSRLSGGFYLMLILSTAVVTLGLILNNVAIIIGGMLITPLLTPVLTLALGVVITDKNLIWRSINIILRSTGVILAISIIIAFLFPLTEFKLEITSRLVSGTPYLLVAFLAGLAATFAWAKKNLSAMLPGVAIAVSLLPPLAVLGIAIGNFNFIMVRGSILTFLLNLFGIVIGSIIIFSILNFYRARKETVKAVKKEIKQEKIKKEKENGKKEIKVSEIKKEVVKAVKEEVKKEMK